MLKMHLTVDSCKIKSLTPLRNFQIQESERFEIFVINTVNIL